MSSAEHQRSVLMFIFNLVEPRQLNRGRDPKRDIEQLGLKDGRVKDALRRDGIQAESHAFK
jgi:hypothetical protein